MQNGRINNQGAYLCWSQIFLSLDAFSNVSVANLVLLKLYSLVPQNKRSVRYRCAYCVCHCFPFSTNVGAG